MCRLTKNGRRAGRGRTSMLFASGVEQIVKHFAPEPAEIRQRRLMARRFASACQKKTRASASQRGRSVLPAAQRVQPSPASSME
jgi:hypothetical protein